MKISLKFKKRKLIRGEYMFCKTIKDIDVFYSLLPNNIHNDKDLDKNFFIKKLQENKNGIYMIFMKREDTYNNNDILYSVLYDEAVPWVEQFKYKNYYEDRS